MLDVVRKVAAERGFDIKVAELTDYVVPNQALAQKYPKGPYANLIAVHAADKDKPWVKILVESYQTPEIKEFILTKFKGAVLPAW